MLKALTSAWPGYEDALARARAASGEDESVQWSIEDFSGAKAVVARLSFAFMGGSMGVVHGDRIVDAVDAAIEHRIPFVSVIRSGGARTHEGFDALIQMRRTLDAMTRAREAGIPLIAWFRNPTTGGVHASYGAAADLVVAERGATVGFAGPRVVEALAGAPLDGTSHTAEAYAAAGLVDALADDEADARRVVGEWIALVSPSSEAGPADRPVVSESGVELTGWAAVERARDERRPTARAIVASISDAFSEMAGDRAGSDDRSVLTALARVAGERVMFIGTDRHAPGAFGRIGAPAAAGFRKARRAVAIAVRWGIPVVSLVDTRGADPVPQSDSNGLAVAISELMSSLSSAAVPTLSVVTGEGGSGGAMAFAATDRMVMQDDAVFEVIAPEGAASILYRDASRAREIAELMGLGAASLRARGFSHATLPGPTTHGIPAALAALRDEVLGFLLDARTPRATSPASSLRKAHA